MKINIKNYIVFIGLMLLLAGCEQKAERTFYETNITNEAIPCLKMQIQPPDPMMSQILESLYPFSKECPYLLTLSYKSNIVCNSPYNVQSKALGKMPSSYIKLELRKGLHLLYSYYKDLDHTPKQDDIVQGFKTLKDDLKGVVIKR
ncbi:MAG: hypothetical protein DSZ10_03190 [Sulfurovum sp.]|nr:MAG: hypothetical protein DSZ10_03190 [Sulfurovum sp.]